MGCACGRGTEYSRSGARRSIRAPARDTFGPGPKSVQKGRLNLRFKNPPTLFILQICTLLPRVCGAWFFSLRMTYRLSILRRCRSCGVTVEAGMLYDGASGTPPPTKRGGKIE